MTRINEFDFRVVRDALATAEAQFSQIDAAYDLEFRLDWLGSSEDDLATYDATGPEIELYDANYEGVISVSLADFITEAWCNQIEWYGEEGPLAESCEGNGEKDRSRLLHWKNIQLLARLSAAVEEWRQYDMSLTFEEAKTRRTDDETRKKIAAIRAKFAEAEEA